MHWFHLGYESLRDLLFPPVCIKCGQQVVQHQALCADCWKTLHFITAPLCACCGLPFDLPVEEGTLCASCLADRPVPEKIRSAVVYDEASKGIILRLKHGDAPDLALSLAPWLVRAGQGLLDYADVLAPVPLHRWRLLRRHYNQSALLAREVARQSGVPLAPELLLRTRATDPQGHKNRKDRHQNVKDAFVPNPDYDIAGKKIVLIDDVMTSGATLDACAKALLDGGAAGVGALTLARVKAAG